MEAISISQAMSRSACLVLMFKAPQRSKQRLAGNIGPLAAVAAERLFDCAREDLVDWPGPICFAPAAEDDERWLKDTVEPHESVVLQGCGDLGARINHVNRKLCDAGATRQIFIGIDCPELDSDFLAQADRLLDEHDAVFGPAEDGGVVLMGARRLWPDLSGLDWGGAALGSELGNLVSDMGWRTVELDAKADVDTVDDLKALSARLSRDPRPARQRLRAWIAAQGLDG